MKRQHQDNINTGEHFDNLYAGRRREEMLPYAALESLLSLIVGEGYILDVGCGWGQYYDILTQHGATYYGIDFAEEALTQADENYPYGYWACHDFSIGLPYSVNFFEYVVCFETLEHIEQPQMLISEIHRVLSPGGVALLSVPYRDGVITPEHLWEYEESDWKELLSAFSSVAQFRFSNEADKWEHFLVIARK